MKKPIKNGAVSNYIKATHIYVFDTLSCAAHAAIRVPDPGMIRFKIAEIMATGLLTFGTSYIKAHTILSVSSTAITLFLK
jgi:hypothetical protein